MISPDPFADKLTIETPEQTPLEFALAGIGSRFLALALDSVIQWAVLILLVVLGATLAPASVRIWRAAPMWLVAMIGVVFFCVYYGYFALFEALWNGQTPGKRYTSLRVIQESGRPINAYQAIARNLLRIVDQLPGFYAVGIVSALLSRQNRRLGDYVAGTVVVHEKPFQEVAPAWDAAERASSPARNFGTARLSPEEMQIVETFLQRRSYLVGEVRAQMARQIAERLGQKLGVPPEERRPPALPGGDEAFLEALAHERRALAGYR